MKINPLVYKKKDRKHRDIYDAACCAAHKDNVIEFLDECDHTHPWED
jgi:hypothetical protein